MGEQDIFLEALHILDPAGRAAYLDRACAGDTALRRRVEMLLLAHANACQGPPAADASALDETIPPSEEAAPGKIGPYKLLQRLGEGGMGEVWMAEQQEPVRRRVAIKIIKAGMDSAQVVARFEQERQALAMMDHLHIAKVLDAGTTEHGRPYFVMELVHGLPITRYCDENKLPPADRLALFVGVCHAIQHAHTKGIIHRDIKPSNVMVTLYDGRPVPKVIDFGVAKATEQRLTERTLFTQYGTMVGTLEYMAPEQAEMSALGADTRSDVYSLGVLLYELLTGSTPLESQRLRAASYVEMVRLIKEEEPPAPSLRLSGSGPALAAISQQRGTEPARLKKLVRGELDWIVMKCLDKDRTRRYETADALARDIERYLADDPVEACPPSAAYLLRKFLRRHKGKVVAAAAVLTTLLAGIAGTTVGMIGAITNGRAAILAAENANSAGQVIAQDLLAAAHNFGEPDPDMQLGFALKASVWRIDANERGNLTPSVEMAARMALGRALLGLAEYEEGRRHAERALELGRPNGETHIDTMIATLLVAGADRYLGNYEPAEAAAQRLLDLCWEPRQETRFLTLEVVGLRAALDVDRGRPDEARRLLEASLEAARDRYGEDDEYTLLAYGELLRFYLVHGKAQEAEPLCARALKAAEKGSNQQRRANFLFLWGTCQLRLGRAAEAERLLRDATATGGWAGPDYGRDHLAKTRLGRPRLPRGVSQTPSRSSCRDTNA